MNDEWQRLRDDVNSAADKCVALDPDRADVYRAEAHQFCDIMPPTDVTELRTLKVEAAMLLVQWVRRRPQYAGVFSAADV